MHKNKVKQALENYLSRQEPKKLSARKNNKPEKEVEKQVLSWCRSVGWRVFVVESKAVYSQSAGMYLNGPTSQGFSDVVGLTQDGLFVGIELKAPGRLSTLRPKQREFLVQVIGNHGFGVVVDSAESLKNIYDNFLSSQTRKSYLLSLLPRSKTVNDSIPLF